MSTSRFTDTDAVEELAAWWHEATGGNADTPVTGGDLVNVVRSVLDRARPTRLPQFACPECGHDQAQHYGQRRKEGFPTPRLCRADSANGRTCRCRYTLPQIAADTSVEGSYRALPRMRLIRLSGRRALRDAAIGSAASVYDLIREEAAGLVKEVFWCVLLDGRNRVIDIDEVAVGSLTATLVHPREVFTPAMYVAAAHVILVHNHPSGDPEPSAEDIALTKRLVQAGDVVGIRVLDHVVIGDERFRSFSECGLI